MNNCIGRDDPETSSPFKPFDLLGTEGTTNGNNLQYFVTTGFFFLMYAHATNVMKLPYVGTWNWKYDDFESF